MLYFLQCNIFIITLLATFFLTLVYFWFLLVFLAINLYDLLTGFVFLEVLLFSRYKPLRLIIVFSHINS
jgi:hypothetical protein